MSDDAPGLASIVAQLPVAAAMLVVVFLMLRRERENEEREREDRNVARADFLRVLDAHAKQEDEIRQDVKTLIRAAEQNCARHNEALHAFERRKDG